MKIRLILGLALTCSSVFAQTPRPVAAYINGGSGWNPWSSVGGFGSLSFTPQPIALYCQASAGAAWQPCNPSGGGGSGTVTSVASGNMSPLFNDSVANSTTTPSITHTAIAQAANTVFGNFTAGSANPTFSATPVFSAATLTNFPTLNQNTTGSAATWTTARTLAGNSVDGSANVAFANKVILQGTTDAGFSAAQFLGALATGPLCNTITTGVLTACGVTGTGNVVQATTPTLVTPVLGVASATSINKVTITAPGTSATLTLITGSSLITAGANALTLTSTAASNATFPAGTTTLTQTVASGQTAIPVTALAANTCDASATTATATGAATTDAPIVSYASDPTAVTGYGGGTSGGISIRSWTTLNTFNFKRCNESGSSITPGALNLNWRVTR